ncbi:MAG: hypothetical protein IKX79_02175 [Desulfovibrionaceae bacterium]|nr:hypothetical protein [Desulfovibrionaceae bacterium]
MTQNTNTGKPLLAAIAGLALALWNLLAADTVPCTSSGCALQHDFSLWGIGAGVFGALILCSLVKAPKLGLWLSGLALACDMFLLILMLLTATCPACLVSALLLALCFVGFIHASRTPWNTSTPPLALGLLYLWSMLFVIDTGLLVRDIAAPWAISVPEKDQPKANIYFSTSCQACRNLLLGMRPADLSTIAWYPVAEKKEDLRAIHALEREIRRGVPLDIALRRLPQDLSTLPSLSIGDFLRLKIRLGINRSRVLISGRDALPFVQFFGVPSALLHHGSEAASAPASSAPSAGTRPAAPARRDHSIPYLNFNESGLCTGQQSTHGGGCR